MASCLFTGTSEKLPLLGFKIGNQLKEVEIMVELIEH